jgi:glycolate oxidase FAD binding subunit
VNASIDRKGPCGGKSEQAQNRDPSERGERAAPPIAELAERIGAQHLHGGTSADRIDGQTPRWIARPGSVAEAQAVLRFAERYALTVVPVGLGGHLDVGGAARAVDIALSLDRLDRVIDHVAGDMTVTVEPGCSLGDLDERLAAASQWLPIDPPFAAETSVGGLVAANLAGPLRASQGTVRDYLIGVKTVTAEGRLAGGGGRVVKNVAGYDVPKLHVGALGTLGIVVEATFKVRPRPEREAAIRIDCREPRDAGALALDLRDAVEPDWLEIVGPGALGPDSGVAVIAGFLGSDAEVDAAIRRVGERSDQRIGSFEEVDDPEGLRQRIVDSARGAAVLRVATLPGDLAAIVDCLPEDRGLRWHAHATAGSLRIGVPADGEVAALVRDLRPRAEGVGGSLVVERATPIVKSALDPDPGLWGAPPPGLALMRGLKSALDPSGRLSPGRFFGEW